MKRLWAVVTTTVPVVVVVAAASTPWAGPRPPRTASRTDQFGTQLEPPAHWAPDYAAIDEPPATFALRPLAPYRRSAGSRSRPGMR